MSKSGIVNSMVEKYQLEAKLGVGLLHCHVNLQDSEKLVEFNNISLPWKNQNGDDHSGGKIVPNAGAVNGDKLFPYEFYCSPLGRDSPFDFEATGSFLSEFMPTTPEFGLE